MEIKYSPEVRAILKMSGMTDKQINQEEVVLSQHEKRAAKTKPAEIDENLQRKFDSSSLHKLGS